MAESGRVESWLTFTAHHFDHGSELPATYNAGNRFYGRDVAEFVSTGLNARGMESSVFDEDFGWMVHAPLPDDGVLEIFVYHNIEGEPATDSDWALLVRAVTKEKWLGIVPRVKERELDPALVDALETVFRDAGIQVRREERSTPR